MQGILIHFLALLVLVCGYLPRFQRLVSPYSQLLASYDGKEIEIVKNQQYSFKQYADLVSQTINSKRFVSLSFRENRLLGSSGAKAKVLQEGKVGSHALKEVTVSLKALKKSLKKPLPTHAQFHYRYQTNDQVKNYDLQNDSDAIRSLLISLLREIPFNKATLTTTANTSTTNARQSTDQQTAYYFKRKFHQVQGSEDSEEASERDRSALTCYYVNELKSAEPSDTRLQHNERKQHLVPIESPFLQSLQLTYRASPSSDVQLKSEMKDKFYQINNFMEILQSLLSPLLQSSSPDVTIRVTDMGSGKGYLTFSIYDFLRRQYQEKSSDRVRIAVEGIEHQRDLIDQMALIRQRHLPLFTNLSFQHAGISSYTSSSSSESKSGDEVRVLVALHACDTATDEALNHAIQHDYDVILAVPCCHKELRGPLKDLTQQLKSSSTSRSSSSPLLSSRLRHGKREDSSREMSDINEVSQTVLGEILRYNIYRERWNDIITDTLRSLALQYFHYDTNVIEFVTSDHTAKNIMIAAVKKRGGEKREEGEHEADVRRRILDLMRINGVTSQHLLRITNLLPHQTKRTDE